MNNTKPNFLIIGAAKAATTTLSNLLAMHPEACMVKGKEPHFFSTDQYYNLGWQGYQQLYTHCENNQICGDGSTSYSRIRYCPDTISRIKSHVPDVKIIYMVRHPVERMVSAYVERLATAGLNQMFTSVNDAVQRQPMIIDSSRYFEVYDAYRNNFPEENIKIVFFEEFIADIEKSFADICDFLGIEYFYSDEMKQVNQNTRDDAKSRISALGRDHIKLQTKWDKSVLKWVKKQIREDTTQFLKCMGKSENYWRDL